MWRSPELARAQLPAHTKHASDVRGWAVRMPRVASAPEVLRRFGDHVKKELRKTQRWQLRASKRAAHCCRMLPGQLLPLQPCGSWCAGWCADVCVCTRVSVAVHVCGQFAPPRHTSILIRPALCPPMLMSKNTTGFPAAAPGMLPMPDIAQLGRKAVLVRPWPTTAWAKPGSAQEGTLRKEMQLFFVFLLCGHRR